jgi:hypothetical protein
MVHTPKEAVYRSKGFDFAIAPVKVNDLSIWLPDEELSFVPVRAIQSNPDQSTYALLAVPTRYKEAPHGLIQAKGYLVGNSHEDKVFCHFVKTADYATRQMFGRVLLAHDILSATQDPTINSYGLRTNHTVIKELLVLFGVDLHTTGRKKGIEEIATLDFAKDEERDKLRERASFWLSNFKLI